ncbi:MAG: MG2 domain-containing protein [Thermoguttaceae bacterium]|jgi:uncharacterized protein YfaS (alpha-2-macroglobulin family)|nr:MG2 domain-containing protein [Thermoguttaceae bacterium]
MRCFPLLRSLSLLAIVGCAAGVAVGALATEQQSRQLAQKTMNDGNFNDAYQVFYKLATDPKSDPRQVGSDVGQATQCLQRLNRLDEVDAFYEAVVAAHVKQWRVLWAVAEHYMNVQHQGFIVAGEFSRGPKRGNQGGTPVNSVERDRVRALQLMNQAWPLAREDDDHASVGSYLLAMARVLLNSRGFSESWRLQYLTDLSALPDYDEGWGYYGQTMGAPVDRRGNPVLHRVPKSLDEARTDGQRWRWCLEQTIEFNPQQANGVRSHFADFLLNQFGVQTMADFGWRFGRGAADDSREAESGTWAMHTLDENETIARLATGVKRFALPDEFNFIKIYRQIADQPQTGHGEAALRQLAQIFENRRQYPKAAETWRRVIEEYPASESLEHYRDRLSQIVDNWGQFEPVTTQPAGQGATVEYRFRNGHIVELKAHAIKVETLLDDVKNYLKSKPGQIDGQRANIGDIGYRLVRQNEEKYLGEQVAQWKMVVKPRQAHFDKRVTVATPLRTAGAYLLEATMKGGNTGYIVLWVADTAIIRKPLEGKSYHYVADAVTGAPVAKANVEFFGWRVDHRAPPGRRTPRDFQVVTKQFAEHTDADGQLLVDERQAPSDFQWLATARTNDGRFAYLGFSGVWYARIHDPDYRAVKAFPVTDRPVYRPEQKVHFKFWVQHAQYDQDEVSQFAGQSFTVEIIDGRQEKVLEHTYKADEYGGFEGELDLPKDATLGQYGMTVRQGDRHFGGGSFRVEEYKKPEFEVSIDAPDDPVMLGELIEATIKANYYFGSPVTSAKVKYKVTRTPHTQPWYPPMPWDWFYGPGYWWFGYDYDWYPGWQRWGCVRPMPFWWPQRHAPPELVAEREVEIGEDGTVSVSIDTSLAKALYGDQNHRYEITAEVTDQSRRTIVGVGEVLVAREAFKVHSWVDRGYYRVGDTIRANFQARRIDGKPVEGKGKLTLYRIGYENGKPKETPVQDWQLATGADGQASQQLTASQGGQYRLSYKVTDANKHTIEGGYLFTIVGEGFDSAQFRFNHLELIPDKQDYAPGEKVKLQVNTDRAGGTVLLFVRPTNGVYLEPAVIRLDGKSTVHEIEVAKRDMPNFFVEAVTLADAAVHTETKEIAVPPEKRVLNVEIEPSKEAYRPGEKAKVQLTLTDFTGEPFVGSAVVTIYDKSVEYISGGSNVPEIKEFFWKWRRSHHPSTESSLAQWFHNLMREGAKVMGNIGVFGETVAEEMDGLEMAKGEAKSGRPGRMQAIGEGGGRGGMAFGAAPPGALMEMRTMARPEAAAAPMADAKMEVAAHAAPTEDAGAAPMAEATVRTEFADTALWVGAITTAKNGTAEVELDMPENLTTWRIKVWGMGHGTRVGEGFADVVTRKDLILRLQSPRFFVQSDEVVLSANVHNYLAAKKRVDVKLELDGDVLELLDKGAWTQTVAIEPAGERRIDWRVKVLDEGEATVRMFALTDEESDAMEMKLPSLIHGMLKMEASSGVIRPDQDRAEMTFTVPEERRPEQSRLEVRYSPTLAGAMVDALPYLADYPYGCTEQTLNRFLPTVITQKVLIDMGLDLEDVRAKRANLNAQELGDSADRAQQWKRYDRNPVFDQDEVRRMVTDGVARLTEMQLGDGGWGWFSGHGERSDAHTTAVVVRGLRLAQKNDVALVPGMLEKGVEWLRRYQAEQVQLLKNALIANKPPGLRWKNYADNLDALVYMVLVDAEMVDAEMNEILYRDRTRLAVYALAMYGVALHEQGNQQAKLEMVGRNIGQYVQQDDENQTAWLNLPGGYWWHWYGSEYEAHAYFLKLLSRTNPDSELASRLVKYLLNNRKHATYWNSTRDTSLCIEAMAEFLRASGEDKSEMTVQVYVGGELKKAVEITPQTLFQFDDRFILEAGDIPSGPLAVELRREGAGPVYFNGYLANFTLEDFITKAGLEIQVQREYYKLVRVEATRKGPGSRGQVVDQKVEKYERQKLDNQATLQSGDLVEVELVIESKNDYEYLVFEDMKPAGFEPVDLRSGYTGNPLGAYVEFRDERVVMFVRRLARGKHSTSYRMRAEIPGKFSALPTKAWAMYAPELKANSDEIKLNVKD